MPSFTRTELLKALTASFRQGDFTLTSGRKSDFYVDVKRVALSSSGAMCLGGALYAFAKTCFPRVAGVGGLELGAVPLINGILIFADQDQVPLHGFIVRKELRAHGSGRLVEGAEAFKKGDKVLIVDDVLTSGSSTVRAAHAARELGLEVVGVLAVVDRQEGGREELEKHKLPVHALFTKKDFMS